MSAFIAFVASGGVGLVAGLRWKHRRFLVVRNRVAALEARMDAYRLADSRTDLDEVGPVGTNPQKRDDLRAEYDEDLADIVLVASRMATDTGGRHSLEEVMAKHGFTQAELDALPDDPPATWSGASHLQSDPADDTGEGTVAHLRSGEWAPAAPAPKRVGQ